MKEKIPEELVRDYLQGKLSPADRDTFKKRLETDLDLVRELAVQRAEMAASELLIASESRELFREWQSKNSPRRGAAGFTPLLWLGGIAAGLLLLFAAIRFFQQPAGPAASAEDAAPPLEQPLPGAAENPAAPPPVAVIPEKPGPATLPSKDYFTLAKQLLPAPVLSNLRQSPTDSAASAYRRAEQAFAAGDYQKTLDLLARTDSTRWQSAAFLSAHAMFRLKRIDEAEKRFSLLAEQNSRQFRYSAEWGRLMCRLAGYPERERQFREQLNDILTKPDHPNYEQAKALDAALK